MRAGEGRACLEVGVDATPRRALGLIERQLLELAVRVGRSPEIGRRRGAAARANGTPGGVTERMRHERTDAMTTALPVALVVAALLALTLLLLTKRRKRARRERQRRVEALARAAEAHRRRERAKQLDAGGPRFAAGPERRRTRPIA
jgi:hypothetical protein